MQILPRNKGNFEGVATLTVEKFPAVYRQNLPCPFGLWQKSLLAALKGLNDEPHRPAPFALRTNDFCRQRNRLEFATSA